MIFYIWKSKSTWTTCQETESFINLLACTFVCHKYCLCSWHILPIDNLMHHQVLKLCSAALYAHLFFLVSPTYALLFWCYPDKFTAAVSVTSHSYTMTSCCLVTAQNMVSSLNTDVYVWEACLPIITKVSKAVTVDRILTGYWVCWFLCHKFNREVIQLLLHHASQLQKFLNTFHIVWLKTVVLSTQ